MTAERSSTGTISKHISYFDPVSPGVYAGVIHFMIIDIKQLKEEQKEELDRIVPFSM